MVIDLMSPLNSSTLDNTLYNQDRTYRKFNQRIPTTPFTTLYNPERSQRRSNQRISLGTIEDVLYPLIEKNRWTIIAGGFFGDEGKGKITDAIANHPEIGLVARVNSGQNAGHTVVHNGVKYVMHIVPSSILIEDVISVIGPNCVVDPVTMMNEELIPLAKAGIDYSNRLFIDDAYIVTPNHIILDFLLSAVNSSTYKGMKGAFEGKVGKHSLSINDVLNNTVDNKSLRKDLKQYEAILKSLDIETPDQLVSRLEEIAKKAERKIPKHIKKFAKLQNNDERIGYLKSLYDQYVKKNLFPKAINLNQAIKTTLERTSGRNNVGIEAPQSYWLSNEIPTHRSSTTSGQTHAWGVLASANINPQRYHGGVFTVIKDPFGSRVGAGANPVGFVRQNFFADAGLNNIKSIEGQFADFDKVQTQFYKTMLANPNTSIRNLEEFITTSDGRRYRINEAFSTAGAEFFSEFGASTGKPRVLGFYDAVAASQVNHAQGPYLVISALDRGDSLDYVGIVTAYTVDLSNTKKKKIKDGSKVYQHGDVINIGDEYPSERVLEHCVPHVELHKGWKNTPISAKSGRTYKTLPKNVSSYVKRVEELTGFDVVAVGNGRETDNLLYLKKGHRK